MRPLQTVSHFVPVSSKIDAVSTSFYLTMAVVKLSQCSASQSGRAISGWFCNRRSCVRSTCILPYRSLRILSRSTKKLSSIVWLLIIRFSLCVTERSRMDLIGFSDPIVLLLWNLRCFYSLEFQILIFTQPFSHWFLRMDSNSNFKCVAIAWPMI